MGPGDASTGVSLCRPTVGKRRSVTSVHERCGHSTVARVRRNVHCSGGSSKGFLRDEILNFLRRKKTFYLRLLPLYRVQLLQGQIAFNEEWKSYCRWVTNNGHCHPLQSRSAAERSSTCNLRNLALTIELIAYNSRSPSVHYRACTYISIGLTAQIFLWKKQKWAS